MEYSSCKRIYISGECLGKLPVVLEKTLESHKTVISYFAEYEDCLRELNETPCDLLVIDVEECPEEAIDVLTRAVRTVPTMVILWLTQTSVSGLSI